VNREKLAVRASEAVTRATDYLYGRQRDDGAWTDRLSSSPMTTALALLALARIDPQLYRSRLDAGLRWLKRYQREDGGWSMADAYPPSSPGTTAFAAAALEALDPVAGRPHIERGMAYIRANGGEAVIPGMTGRGPRTWPTAAPIAWVLAGLRDPREQPYQPFEVILLPQRLRNKVSIGLPGVLGLGIMQSRSMPVSAPPCGMWTSALPGRRRKSPGRVAPCWFRGGRPRSWSCGTVSPPGPEWHDRGPSAEPVAARLRGPCPGASRRVRR